MERKSSAAVAPYLVDIAVNLTDCVFRGVDWSGQRLHEDDFDLVMKRADDQGIKQLIITGTSLLQCEKAIAMCRRYPDRRLLCTVGVHPAHCGEFARPMPTPEDIEQFIQDDASGVQAQANSLGQFSAEEERANGAARLAHLRRLVENNRDVVVAVGEIGIDYAELLYCPRETQEKYFVEQLRAFRSLGLPFLLHSRECGMRFVELLQSAQTSEGFHFTEDAAQASGNDALSCGVVHSFNGTMEEQSALLSMGLYLSLNGSAFRTQEAARQVLSIPRSRLMLETDAPWCDIRSKDYGYGFVKTQFPTNKRKKPFVRGKCLERRNEPCHLVQVLEAYLGCAATERAQGHCSVEDTDGASLTQEQLVAELCHNCKRVFKLD